MGQWRECCAIARNIANKGTPKHLLVNKILYYPIAHFYYYASMVSDEMEKRGYKCDFSKFTKHITLDTVYITYNQLFSHWHNPRYLLQCYYNLQEKYDCGGITEAEYKKIYDKVQAISKYYVWG